MKRYEGLFILDTAGKEEGIKDTIDRISAEINAAGGRIHNVQKMDKRPFVRVADKKHSSGFFVNILFETAPSAIAPLRTKLALNGEVFRALFTEAPAPKEVAAK